ncbi:MAG: RdgB/HAM1 family non-canonical purine NTP pyrophosphatase [Burkholderiaceae bacterium]
MRLVLASHNAKKLAEMRSLFAPLGFDCRGCAELGIPEPEEPHDTFVENALIKARHAARHAGCAALADDSGLCVLALDGAPGVNSATFARIDRFAAERETQRRAQDHANNALLLERLRSVTDRRAHFVSTLVALRSADDPEPLIAVGRWSGEILESPRGSSGFGYDPLLFIPALGHSVAELDLETKNRVSHRALAAQRMVQAMREGWQLA